MYSGVDLPKSIWRWRHAMRASVSSSIGCFSHGDAAPPSDKLMDVSASVPPALADGVGDVIAARGSATFAHPRNEAGACGAEAREAAAASISLASMAPLSAAVTAPPPHDEAER